ncbi:hypothetical protein P4118_19860 [Pseudomonas aeruginosa]|nr:hypothetical protein [Pseudomonas aeruginosa]
MQRLQAHAICTCWTASWSVHPGAEHPGQGKDTLAPPDESRTDIQQAFVDARLRGRRGPT